MATAYLIRGRHQRILLGHPWVYQNEIERVAGEFEPGDIVDVRDSRNRLIGRGYINPKSMITIRLLTRDDEQVDDRFVSERIRRALDYRRNTVGDIQCYRLVNAEADMLPGLIVDRFGEYLVFQTLTLGMDMRKPVIIECLDEMLSPKGIYERNDVPVRELEGLRQCAGFAKGPFDTLVDTAENGLKITVDVQRGQKTGHFLDQRENRLATQNYACGRRVLDCFCHTGGFALNAALAGAEYVLGVDQSESALLIARKNAMDNSLAACEFVASNAFDFLRSEERRGSSYDLVILDPPAFAKSRSALAGAIRGYKEINLRAMKILNPGGTLITCSCSHHLDEAAFGQMLLEAAFDAGKTLRLIEKKTQPKDHPILLAAPETAYLKCFFFEVF